ncbi:MAG: Rpn family recombination-promoting nuclease/putative transposase [Treponema sp.]|nr:Rpn family recombination-promoting nuclease/putative transposase [Treponema sp.]
MSNREYRDSVFVDLFSKDRDAKKNALSLYNALHGTSLKEDETEIEFIRIENVLYKTFRNDVSMLINGRLVMFIEHQSTVNENMPLRYLSYATRVYERLIENRVKFSRRMAKVPTPEFYVFYNGSADLPPVTELRLSDAFFEKSEKTLLELCVTVYNINKVVSPLKYCKPLCDYAEFGKIVLQERKYNDSNYIESAVQKCVKADILAEYLVRKNKEVENMVFGEYDYAMDIAVQREEAWEEGVEEGMQRGVAVGIAEERVDIARNMMTRGFSANDISDITGLSLEEVQAL